MGDCEASMDKKARPKIIDEVGFDFHWDERKVWKLDVPIWRLKLPNLLPTIPQRLQVLFDGCFELIRLGKLFLRFHCHFSSFSLKTLIIKTPFHRSSLHNRFPFTQIYELCKC